MNQHPIVKCLLALAGLLALTGMGHAGQPLLIISIDGLPPRYLANAEALGLKIPQLRSFLKDGAAAQGVVGVLPTVTYPSHTTIMTGVPPAEHGVFANTPFDPLLKNQEGWYWYASDIRTPTLWSAAAQAGLRTASVNWPVTVGDTSISTLLPEFWRASTPEDLKLLRALTRPQGRLETLERKLGPFVDGNTETVESDAIRTRFAIELLKTEKPQLLAVHLIALDGTEHHDGPDTPAAFAVLESLDAMIGELTQAALAAQPATVVAIVSDHGFIATHTLINLRPALIAKGLIKVSNPSGGAPIVNGWDVQTLSSGGSVAVMLKDPADTNRRLQVGKLLRDLAADPANGIAAVLEAAELHKAGGFPEAVFGLEAAPGFYFGNALEGPLLRPATSKGTHGYLPTRADMHAVLYLKGKGIVAGRSLGVVDMRQLAPTFAAVLQVPFPTAKQPMLSVFKPGSD